MSQALAAHIGVGGVFWGALAFIAVVSTFWPWWKSQLGWTIIAKSAALALAVFPTILYYWFGAALFRDVPWVGWLAIGGLWLIPPILAWRAWIIWHTQRRARDII